MNTDLDKLNAFNAGWHSYWDDEFEDNPYKTDQELRDEWYAGYAGAQALDQQDL